VTDGIMVPVDRVQTAGMPNLRKCDQTVNTFSLHSLVRDWDWISTSVLSQSSMNLHAVSFLDVSKL